VSYNAILGVIAVFSAGAIRQFCVLAIVVLVAHWFLAHTFFMAVLSIDIQRLEVSFLDVAVSCLITVVLRQLDELLRQNSSLVPAVPSLRNGTSKTQPRSRWRKLVIVAQNFLRGRATKNISLLLVSPVMFPSYPISSTILPVTRNYCYPLLYYLPYFNSD
jgi:hypothetical protein